MAPFRSHEQSCIGKWLRFGAKTKNFPRGLIFRLFRCLPGEGINIFSSDLIFGLSRDLPLEGEKSARDIEKDFFGRTLKMPLSHSSHYEDMYLDNCIAVTETDMTVRRPQKSEHGDAAEIPGQAYKNDIGSTVQHPL